MSPLQWALLIFAVLAVIAIYLFSRRDRRALERSEPEADLPAAAPARERQLDIFGAEGQQFDEFGVGRPRRIEPRLESWADAEPSTMAPPISTSGSRIAPLEPPPPLRPSLNPGAGAGSSQGGVNAGLGSGPGVNSGIEKPTSQKIVALLIADREGRQIQGLELHEALETQGLKFGMRQIYHRLVRNEPVFSVASLLKPGHLDPAAAQTFSTPGLTLFMVLPGPVRGSDAIRDMISTAEKLARELDAEVFDSKKQSFTPSSARALQLEVDAWARSHAGA